MNFLKPLQWAGLALGVAVGFYLLYSYLPYFAGATFLGGILVFEIPIAGLWKYDSRFVALIIVSLGLTCMFPCNVSVGFEAIVSRWFQGPRG